MLVAVADGLAVVAIVVKTIVTAVGIIFEGYLEILLKEAIEDSENRSDSNDGTDYHE